MTKWELEVLKEFSIFASEKLNLPEPEISHDFSECPYKERGIGWNDGKCTIYVHKEDMMDFNLLCDVAYMLRRVWQVNNEKTFTIPNASLTGDQIDGLAFAWGILAICFNVEPRSDLPVTTVAIVMNRMGEVFKELLKE